MLIEHNSSRMTDAKFCDLHENKEGSLIRVGKESFYTVKLTRTVNEKNAKTGKTEKWQQDSTNLASCHSDVMKLIIDRAKGLGVDVDWGVRYKLGQVNGKFSRIIHPDDDTKVED